MGAAPPTAQRTVDIDSMPAHRIASVVPPGFLSRVAPATPAASRVASTTPAAPCASPVTPAAPVHVWPASPIVPGDSGCASSCVACGIGARSSGPDDSDSSTYHGHTRDAFGEPSPNDHEGQGWFLGPSRLAHPCCDDSLDDTFGDSDLCSSCTC
jgi:hypothetical protein